MTRFVLGLLLGAVLMAAVAYGQPVVAPQSCASSLGCQQQRVADLVDYRAFVEDQLALAKSLVRDLQQQLQAAADRLKACAPEAPK